MYNIRNIQLYTTSIPIRFTRLYMPRIGEDELMIVLFYRNLFRKNLRPLDETLRDQFGAHTMMLYFKIFITIFCHITCALHR